MKMCIPSNSAHQHGFTLVEVLVAIFIFAFSITALVYSQTQASRKYMITREETIASLLAQNIMALAETKLENKPFESTDKSENGEGQGLFTGYKWKWTLHEVPFELPPLSAMAPKSDNDEANPDEAILKFIGDAINQHLKDTWRELSVEITWNSIARRKEQKFILTTHLADLKKQPSFVGPTGAGSGSGSGTGGNP
jgi:type II secretion system protein I